MAGDWRVHEIHASTEGINLITRVPVINAGAISPEIHRARYVSEEDKGIKFLLREMGF